MVQLPALHGKIVARYHGELFHAYNSQRGNDFAKLVPVDRTADPGLPGFAWSDYDQGYVADVALADLDERYVEWMKLTWRGQPFTVTRIDGDRALVVFAGADYGWAKNSGLAGDQYSGYVDWIDLTEATDVHVDRTDLLTDWRATHGA